jgi:hypothetical protein
MNFRLGEFVRFVDENREGYITRIIDEQLVGVTGEDDFEIPVAVNNLARVHGHKSNEGVISDDSALNIAVTEFVSKGIFISVVPDLNKGSIVHFYITNETSYELLFAMNSEKSEAFKGEFFGMISPHSSIKIYSAALPDLDLWPKFHFRVLTYTRQSLKPETPINSVIKFRAKDFSGTKKTIGLLKLQGWQVQLDEAEIKIDAEKLKESFFKPAEEKKSVDRPSKEVDLHIEKLRDDHAFLSKTEILDIQLQAFQRNLDAAIAHKFSDMIFIHGLGNGTLKNLIHKTVSKHPQVKTFKDAFKEKFGYGATEVIFK